MVDCHVVMKSVRTLALAIYSQTSSSKLIRYVMHIRLYQNSSPFYMQAATWNEPSVFIPDSSYLKRIAMSSLNMHRKPPYPRMNQVPEERGIMTVEHQAKQKQINSTGQMPKPSHPIPTGQKKSQGSMDAMARKSDRDLPIYDL